MGYSLLPTMPGLFEFPFMTGGGTPVHDRLARLWTDYHEEALSHEFGGSKTPVMRCEFRFEHTIDAHSEVMHFELVSKMLERQRRSGSLTALSPGKCGCV